MVWISCGALTRRSFRLSVGDSAGMPNVLAEQ
jgi:hypothetical protein